MLRIAKGVHGVTALIAAVMLGTAAPAHAQASLYVPLDDIAYRYADALIARGELRGLSLVERPYTARQLAAGADTVLLHGHSPAIRSFAIALRTALQRYTVDSTGNTTSADAPKFIANADAFATAQSSGERELMQADSNRSVTGGAGFRLAMVAGPVVALIHPIVDNRLNNDPDFSGRKDRAIAGRTEDAYVAGQWQYADVFVGRITRNWGPYALQGQLLGSAPYSYDHAYLRVGTDAVHLAQLATRLDDAFRPDGVYARWFYAHRLGVRWHDLEVAATEGFIASGIGRSMDPTLVNPLNIYALSWRNERLAGNLNIGGNLAYRTRAHGTYASELFIDNLQIDRCNPICKEPSSYGITASAEGVPLWGDHRLFASYARLSGLAYRNKDLAGQYTSLGIGLGEPFADFDEARLGVDLAAIPYTTLRVYGAFRRQGQGDYHLPYPTPDQYAITQGFLQGVVEHVARAGVSGATMVAPGLELTADVGFDRTTNADHLAGTTRNAFAGRARMQWTPRSLTF